MGFSLPEIILPIVFIWVFFSNEVVYTILIWVCICFFFFFSFSHRTVAACFVAELLWRIVMSLTVSFFIGFRVGNLDGEFLSNKVISSNHVRQYATDLKS